MKKEVKYQNYKITYYLFPGINEPPSELRKIHKKLLFMNKESGKNFKYGIFDPKTSFKEKVNFYKKIIVAIYETPQGELAGFFYNFHIEENNKDLLHQGLVVIYKNSGLDLLMAPYLYSNILFYDYLKKDYYVSNISAVPSIIGIVSEIFDNVWPSFYSKDQRFPPNEDYKFFANKLYESYVQTYFPDGTVFDKKRFVLKSPLKEMGFGLEIRDLPRHKDINHIIFSFYWIDLNKGEDIVQIGVMSKKRREEFEEHLKSINFNIIKT